MSFERQARHARQRKILRLRSSSLRANLSAQFPLHFLSLPAVAGPLDAPTGDAFSCNPLQLAAFPRSVDYAGLKWQLKSL
jgi:hypothetical protein